MNTQKTGEFITELRKEKNLTQAQLAEILNVSDKAISRWETGRGFPDINNLEALSENLGVTVAELLMGEKADEGFTKEDVQTISSDSLSLVRTLLEKRKYANILIGFLVGLVILITVVVHMTSPIYLKDGADSIKIEELNDGSLVAVMDGVATGHDIDTATEPEGGENEVFISCYTTRWDQLRKKAPDTIFSIGSKSEIDKVYYYPSSPSADGNQLLYSSGSEDALSGGATILPRLVYNYWLAIGIMATIVGLIIYAIFRKKYFADKIIKVTALPAAFTVSTLICLMGKFDEVYNAAFYFSGIVLLALAIYALFLVIMNNRKLHKSK